MTLRQIGVTILGGGIAGLAMAQALAQRGAGVTLLEQAEAITEVGAGLQISPNGAVVLESLGLGGALERDSLRCEAVELRDGFDGALVTRLDMARLRPEMSWHFLHRADLIAMLEESARARGVEIRLGHKVASVDLSGARPIVRLASGQSLECELLIGADGLRSPTRQALNGTAPPFFTRQVAWRALLPCEPGARNVAEVHMGHGRHLVSYPLRGGRWRNIVAVEERDGWADESWSQRGNPEELRRAFASFGPRVKRWLADLREVWLWGLFRHPVAANWQRCLPEGAVALIGDAAHPTLPFMAQGANMALEDVWSLAATLEAEGTAGLAGWQAARAPRCARIVEAANRNARNYHLSGPIRPLAHAALRFGGWIAPEFALSRFDWLYDHDVTRL